MSRGVSRVCRTCSPPTSSPAVSGSTTLPPAFWTSATSAAPAHSLARPARAADSGRDRCLCRGERGNSERRRSSARDPASQPVSASGSLPVRCPPGPHRPLNRPPPPCRADRIFPGGIARRPLPSLDLRRGLAAARLAGHRPLALR